MVIKEEFNIKRINKLGMKAVSVVDELQLADNIYFQILVSVIVKGHSVEKQRDAHRSGTSGCKQLCLLCIP